MALCYNNDMWKRGLLLCGILALFGCASSCAEEANISIDVSSASLQLTIPDSANIVLNPSTSSSFGTKSLSFNVATNNPTGYKVLMSVPQTAMLHSSIATANIPTLTETTTESDFPANKWGYKTTGDYNPINLTNEDSSWNNDGPTNGTDHSLTLAAKVDGATAAGTYTNTLNFTAVVNPNTPKLTITFNGNGADGGTMSAFSIFGGETASLPLNTFTRTGYYFNGWNEKTNSTGVGYGDGDPFTAPALTSPQTKTLYAQWVADTGQGAANVGRSLQAAYEQAYVYNPGQFQEGGNNKHGLYVPEKNPATGEYTGNYFEATKASDYEGIPANDLRFAIQDISLLVGNESVCERTTVIGSSAIVLDLRDFTSYYVAKMKDGRCWLLDNLALDPTKAAVKAKLSESNTNASAAAISNFINGGNPNGNAGWSSSPVAYEGSTSVYDQPRLYAGNKNLVPQGTDQLASIVLAGGWKAGVYYNYCAASIGTYCYSNGGVDKPNTVYDIDYDICPAGWKMPTGGYSGEYHTLAGIIGDTNFANAASLYTEPVYTDFRTAFRLPFSGGYYYGSVQPQPGKNTMIWAATYAGNYYMYTLQASNASTYSADGVNPHYGDPASAGHPVRCIAK